MLAGRQFNKAMRAQPNMGLAISVLLKLMASESTQSAGRIRSALGIVDVARAGLDLGLETRIAVLEPAVEEMKQKR